MATNEAPPATPPLTVLGDFVIEGHTSTDGRRLLPDPVQAQLVLAHKRWSSEDVPAGKSTTTGNSVAIRMPKELMRSYLVEPGAEIAIRPSRPGFVELCLNPQGTRIQRLASHAAPADPEEPSEIARAYSLATVTDQTADKPRGEGTRWSLPEAWSQ